MSFNCLTHFASILYRSMNFVYSTIVSTDSNCRFHLSPCTILMVELGKRRRSPGITLLFNVKHDDDDG